ncbi:MAG: fructokinase [Candidatus Solibacter sp.]|nr:fructokinase [Candidatus Solibacter sp.]
MTEALYGAIEAGGTKFVCAVGGSATDLRDIRRFSTSHNPLETMAEVMGYLKGHGPLKAVGIATFGPIDYPSGRITTTPKLAWRDFPLRDSVRRAFGVPVGFDTDVNAAAIAEARYGAGQGLENFIYITVGTGIGGGAVVGGKPVHGLLHPEMGHLLVRPVACAEMPEMPKGVCPYHGNCLEGLASGPAIQARWGRPGHELPPDHPAWREQADYLAQACHNLACTLSPQMIVLGGGVMDQAHLFPMIRARAKELMGGYLELPPIEPPGLPYPGLSGALALALEA